MEEDILQKKDEVLLLDKQFTYSLYGTLQGTDKQGRCWFVDINQPGEFLIFYPEASVGLLETGRTISREVFGELF